MTHVRKEKTFFETVSKYPGMDIQIFTGNPKSYSRITPIRDDIIKTREYLTQNNTRLFIHSIYLINTSNYNQKAIDYLNWELKWGAAMGARGVVVHTGKSLKMCPRDALVKTKEFIAQLDINPECPLLVETPAGQGTETLTLREDFIKFISELRELYSNRIGVCVDTCHVFASGYDPEEYLQKVMENFRVNLVHFNDSKTPLGSRKDRHEVPGEGFIGKSKMDSIREFCKINDIPLLME